MLNMRAIGTVLYAAAILLSNAPLHAQTFTWGPVHTISLPAPAVFANLSATDMNGDGNTDICLSLWDFDSAGAVVNFKYVYVGNGWGNFASTPVTVHESTTDYDFGTVQFYDVNGDGYADEVYSYAGFSNSGLTHAGVFAVLLGDGKGNFTQSTSIPQAIKSGSGNSVLASGSFKNDGRLDFVTVYPDSSNPGHGMLTVYLNDGGGDYHVGASIAVTGTNPINPMTGDFNGDGHLDIAWLDHSPEPGTNNRFAIHCLYGNGDGTFGHDKICYTIDGQPWGAVAADLNDDHKTDMVVYTGPKVGAQGALPRVATLLAKQSGGFYWSSSVSAPAFYTFSNYGMPPMGMEDLNGDGFLDVILGSYLFAGGTNGVFGQPQSIGSPGNYNPSYFAPLKKGGLPALFYSANDDGDYSTKLSWQLNTSSK
jgi:hypothetical protein